MRYASLLLVAALFPAGAQAAPATNTSPLVVRAGIDSQTAEEIRTSKADVSKSFELTNTTGAPLTVTLIARSVDTSPERPCAPAESCTLGWSVADARLSPNTPLTQTIKGDDTLSLDFSGKAPDHGSYQSEISIRLPDGSALPSPPRVRIIRSPLTLSDGAVTLGPVGRLTWRIASLAAVSPIPVTIHNNAAEGVSLPSARMEASLRTDDGSGTYSEGAGVAPVSCPTRDHSAHIDLPPQATLNCSMQLDRGSAAGRYRARLSLADPEIDAKDVTVDFTVRYPALFCFLLLIAGGLMGAWAAGYQNSGRRRALETADVLDLSDTYRQIGHDLPPSQAPDARALVEDILHELGQFRSNLFDRRDAEHADDLAALGKRAPFIHRFGLLEIQYRALDAATRAAAKPAYDEAFAAARAAELPDGADGLLDTLHGKLTEPVALADAVAPPPPAPEFFFKIWRARSGKQVRSSVARLDARILLVGIVIASAIGVITLWQPSGAWGSLSDILLALFTGATAALSGAVGLQQLLKGYSLGQIGKTT